MSSKEAKKYVVRKQYGELMKVWEWQGMGHEEGMYHSIIVMTYSNKMYQKNKYSIISLVDTVKKWLPFSELAYWMHNLIY